MKTKWTVLRDSNIDYVPVKKSYQRMKQEHKLFTAKPLITDKETPVEFGIRLFNEQKQKDDQLIQAYNDKLLKSERLIERAKALIAERETPTKEEVPA